MTDERGGTGKGEIKRKCVRLLVTRGAVKAFL